MYLSNFANYSDDRDLMFYISNFERWPLLKQMAKCIEVNKETYFYISLNITNTICLLVALETTLIHAYVDMLFIFKDEEFLSLLPIILHSVETNYKCRIYSKITVSFLRFVNKT